MRLMTNRRALPVAAAGLAAALLLGACSSSGSGGGSSSSAGGGSSGAASSGKPPHETIGYVDIAASGGMQKRWYNFLTAAAKPLGWTVKMTDANGVASTALQGVQSYVSQGVNAIIISCVDTGPLVPGLAAAKAANIPVIALGCEVPPPTNLYSATYAENEQSLATSLNNYLNKALKAKTCQQVAVLQDNTILVGRERSTYFINALKGSGFNIVATPVIPETSIVPSTTTAISATLAAQPGTCAFVPAFDFSVGPAVAELQALGKSSTVGVYSYYADDVNLPLLRKPNSALQAVVDGPVEQVSLVAIDQLLAHFMKGAVIDPSAASSLTVPFTVFTKANAPANPAGYITPWSISTYLTPYLQKWNSTYNLKLR
jgi:ABC-type sugar transport system substrate-binding protein